MESKKSKVFTHKLIALFLAALMVISTFTGVMTVFAKSTDDYHDANLAANFLTWAETTDNQTAEALLDYADLYLPGIMEGLDLGSVKPRGSTRINFSYDVPVIGTISVKGYVDSIDGILELVKYVQENVLNGKFLGRSYKNWIGGDVDNLDFSAVYDLRTSTTDGVVSKCGVAYRSQNDAKDIILTVAKLLYVHANNYAGNNVFNNFVKGTLDIGLIGNFLNLWDALKEPLNMWDNYQTNLVYNIVANVIWQNTDWYSESQIEVFKQDFINNKANQTSWDYDDQLFGKLTSELLQRINIQITYSNKVPEIQLDKTKENYGKVVTDDNGDTVYVKDSSKRRWFFINKYIEQGMSYADAVAAVNANEGAEEGFYCDPNLRYSINEDGSSDGNILLFAYGDKALEVEKTDTVTDIAFHALEIAWSTALEPTLGLLEVDYEGKRNESAIFDQTVSNFDRAYYAWKSAHGGWVTSDSDDTAWKANYSASNVQAWANAVYNNYTYKSGVTASPETFLEGVAATYDFDRSIAEEPQNNWRDIDATKLYVELRYSPLADLYFNKQTGPINLYFAETGATNLKNFFATAFSNYSSIAQGINNGLVAAVKDFFPDSSHIGLADAEAQDGVASLTRPAMTEIKTTDSQTIATTLVTNAAHIFEYAANAADENILGAFYANNASADKTASNNLSEANFEEAALPLLISLLNQLNLTDSIHNEDWDTCIDAEGVAVVALREYLSYVLPDKDYSPLWKVDSRNHLVANFDLNKDGKKELFIDAIMPMARDALGYVLQSYVPCRDADGKEWNVYKSVPTEDTTTIFDILNSILCYYGGTEEFDNSSGSGAATIKGRGAAALLGCVNGSGQCKISTSNDIWENIDIIVDTLLPVVGALQTGTYGECDSYDLLYTKIIQGVLDISDNGGSITNIIKQLVDIINSAPLNTGADVALYDYIVAPTVNGIFGGKYTNQRFGNVIPASAAYFDNDSSSNTKAESPFNSLIHVDTLGKYGDGETGIICILLSNIYEAFGGGNWSGFGDARWQGAMFAIKAVNNFIPSFVPQLKDITFGPVTAKIDIPSYSGLAPNASIGTGNYLTLTNTSLGLNRFYRPDADSKVQREKRYFAEIKSATITDNNGDEVDNIRLSGNASGVILAPGESLKLPVLGNTMAKAQTYGYRVAVTYNMYEAELINGNKPSADGNYLFNADITTYAYMTITVGGSWQATVYPDSRAVKDSDDNVDYYRFATGQLSTVNTAGQVRGTAPNTVVGSSAGSQDGNMVISVPQNIVIPSEDPSVASKFTLRARNNNTSNGADRTYSGVTAFISEGTEYYAVNGTSISSTLSTMDNNSTYSMAYALIDPETGDLLNKDYYDYRIKNNDGYTEWQRGFDRDTLNHMESDDNGAIKAEFDAGRVEERTHVTYTFQEALNAGIVTGVQRTATADGYSYQNVFVRPTPALVAASSSAITWVTPFDGFYFSNHGNSLARNTDSFDKFIEYNGNGVTPSREAYKMNLYIVADSGNPMIVSTNVYVADQSDLYNLTSAYNDEVNKMASYRPADFLDYDEGTQTSANYSAIIDAMTDSLELASTPLSVGNASKVSSVKIAQGATSETTNATGDQAYRPATEGEIPASVLASAYKSEGIYYLNKELTMPIYSNVKLTDADVTNGKDAAGKKVTKVGDTYYLANDVKYESEWDTTTYDVPYYAPVEDEEHIAKNGDKIVYKQTQFVYRDANGEKVNSDDKYDNGSLKWVVKFAVTENVIKPNTPGTENRGAYQQGIDTINYWNSNFSKILKTVGAQSVAEEVTAVRSIDSNNVNYDVASYEKMVKVAREAESLIWYEDATDEEGNYIYDENGNRTQVPVTDRSSMEIEVAVSQFKKYLARAVKRGYIGDKLEAEISDHHAIGGTYANFNATKTGETTRFEYSTKNANEEDDVDVYTVEVAQGTKLGFGTRGEDGYLANLDAEGNKAYTDASWNAYVNALGAAVETAAGQKATVSEIYTAKSHLVMAENNLTPYTGEPGQDDTKFTVTGVITIAENREGTSGKYGVGGISILDASGKELGVSAEDGSFEIQLPKGEASTLTITGDTTVDRTITITGDANVENINIPIVICNYESSDNYINGTDAGLFLNYIRTDYVYANLEASDTEVNGTDAGLFLNFISGEAVVYDAWSQSTYVLD